MFFIPNSFKKVNGNYERKIDGENFTKFEIIYNDTSFKSITKFRNGNQIICYNKKLKQEYGKDGKGRKKMIFYLKKQYS